MKTFCEANLDKILLRISDTSALYCPVKQYVAGSTDYVLNFDKWQPGSSVLLELTVLPPKGFFFRPYEALYSAEVSADLCIKQAEEAVEPFVLFGVHACDMAGIEFLDSVFLEPPFDRAYKARRDAATIVTLACLSCKATCFCETFGIEKLAPYGDARITIIDDCCVWQAFTEKGKRLTASIEDLLSPGFLPHPEVEYLERPVPQPALPLPCPDRMLEIFSSEKWDSLHRTCIACGTCTYLCPTCQCYDIASYGAGMKILCHRAWDSCMNEDFTKMAHGNPRPSHKERFRQRFMHKLVYQQEASGRRGCTGCGRCSAKCPVNLSMQKVISGISGAAGGGEALG